MVDNLSNSRIETLTLLERIAKKEVPFFQIDVTDVVAVEKIFAEYAIDGIIHLAGFKAVGESVEKPLQYYSNNIVSTLVMVSAGVKFQVKKFVFSSSAAVYGENRVPLEEQMPLQPTTNPYGESKAISERILCDTQKAHPELAVSILRYFNPVGAHESGWMGEDPRGIPNNLMPYITQVASGQLKQLRVFGDDYPTFDGTGVRDYIHVMDLAEGHVAALDRLHSGYHIYNLGMGQGTSVLQLIQTFEATNGVQVPFEIVGRRPGDIATCYADVSKARQQLGWTAQRDVADMCRDAWRFEMNRRKHDFTIE